ncbi:MAG: M48 family metallopeptidase [Rhodobiaceae bacterium]|nr:M48 family metallopeptidase [Rhodobiaceae bacterium]MCC0055337.1 M48 family metallopeptidase [Rhodobiaceae bacterium]
MLLRLGRTAKEPPADRQIMTIFAGGRSVPVILRRSPRARRISLRLGQKGDAFVLTLPVRGREGDAIHFAERHRGWMETRLDRLPAQVAFAAGESIPLRGVEHRLEARGGLRGLVRVLPESADGPVISVPGAPEHFSRKLTDFLKAEARRDLTRSAAAYCAAIGVEERRIALRDPATRWGSCSTSGTISFSWRLIMAPPDVLDYLAAHEVAHIAHMNHGAGFWRLVRQICPHTDNAERWLKRHGRDLHAYGPKA